MVRNPYVRILKRGKSTISLTPPERQPGNPKWRLVVTAVLLAQAEHRNPLGISGYAGAARRRGVCEAGRAWR